MRRYAYDGRLGVLCRRGVPTNPVRNWCNSALLHDTAGGELRYLFIEPPSKKTTITEYGTLYFISFSELLSCWDPTPPPPFHSHAHRTEFD